MVTLRLLALSLALGLAPVLPASAEAASWTLERGTIEFEAYQQGAPVKGRFEHFSADILLDPENLSGSRIEVEIDTASVTTGHKDRDVILRSPNLLDVERWPVARFASTELEHLGGEAYQARGQLTIRDVQKDVVLPFTLRVMDHPGEADMLQAEAKGELTISRMAYGVGQGEWASTATVGENVAIAVEIVAAARR